MKKGHLLKLWLVIGIVTGFVSVFFFILTYLNNNVLCDLSCRARNEVLLAFISLSLTGIFVGTISYYFYTDRFQRKMSQIKEHRKEAYSLIDPKEREIFKAIVENNGSVVQSELVKKVGKNKVAISRVLKKMEDKGLITRSKNGMTNKVILSEEMMRLFLDS